jgi:hypothetical protein
MNAAVIGKFPDEVPFGINVFSMCMKLVVFTLPHIFLASPCGLAQTPHRVQAILGGSLCGVHAESEHLCLIYAWTHGL